MAELTDEQFVELVKKAEKEASANICAYKTKLALFAFLGYFVIFVVVAILVALAGGTIAVAFVSTSFLLLLIKKKIIFAILLAIWVFLKALWVKFDAPTGYVLQKKNYPLLFIEIDALTKKLGALKIHQVILDEQLNAWVVQHPRFGLLGGQQNTLTIGLQLLLALPPEEMRSVLAHELGHLSGNHSHFSGWIYRVRQTWNRVMHVFDSSTSFGARLMKWFFDWYAPKFSAYSFALARNNEYEADRMSAELTSRDIAAQALVNVYATAPYIENNYWDEYFTKADVTAVPPNKPYEGLAEFLKSFPPTDEVLSETIDERLKDETHYADTHPALNDRIKALDTSNFKPGRVDKNAAEIWLGDKYQTVLAHFDKSWLEENTEKWRNRYEYVRQMQDSLAEYKGKELDEITDDELWDYALGTLEFESEEQALPLFSVFQARCPESVGAAYYIGRAMAKTQDEEALKHLRIAFNSSNTLEDAARWGYDLLTELGREEEAEKWWNNALEADQHHSNAYLERMECTVDDDYKVPEINDALLSEIKQKLVAHKNVRSAWLAEKALKFKGNDSVYIIAFKPKGIYLSFESVIKKVADSLDIDAELFVVSLWGDTSKLAKIIKKQGVNIL